MITQNDVDKYGIYPIPPIEIFISIMIITVGFYTTIFYAIYTIMCKLVKA
jgi:hypothetical protein